LALVWVGCKGETRPLDPTGFEDAGVVDTMMTMPLPDATAVDAEPPDSAFPDAGPEGKAVGEACASADECLSGDSPYQTLYPTPCVTTADNAWPGGYCIDFCQLSADPFQLPVLAQSDCPQGSVCLPRSERSNPTSPGDIGGCFAECTTDDECRVDEGYYCRRTFWRENGAITFDNGYCAPMHCQSRGCPFSFVCGC
jgi:hypothetical protein